MNRREFLTTSAVIGTGLSTGIRGVAAQQSYPSSAITYIVPFPAGGAGEMTARILAEHVKNRHQANVGVEFRPGAGASIGTGQIARSKPDGSTLGLFSVSPIMVLPHLQKTPYDPLKDFTFITAYVGITIPVYVKSDSQFHSWDELLKFAKANPGKLRWGTAAVRGVAHIATEAALRKEGVQATFVPFAGGADAITALLGGHIEAVVSSDYGPHLDAGSVRLLIETGPDKIPGHEHLPTFRDRGYPVAIPAFYGVLGPAGLPADVVRWWEATVKDMTGTAEYAAFVKRLRGLSLYQDSPAFTGTVQEGHRELGKQIQELGIKP